MGRRSDNLNPLKAAGVAGVLLFCLLFEKYPVATFSVLILTLIALSWFVWKPEKKFPQDLPAKPNSSKTTNSGSIVEAKFEKKTPYHRKDYLLTKTEKHFFDTLRQIAYKNSLLVFAKIRMEDLIRVPEYTDNQWGWRNRIKSRHIDFALCNAETVRPLLAIELDDPSHSSYDRIERDRMVDQIFKDAGLPLLHVRAAYQYDLLTLENQIRASAGNVLSYLV